MKFVVAVIVVLVSVELEVVLKLSSVGSTIFDADDPIQIVGF